MENNYKNIIESIREDIGREGLKNTPKRASEALKFLTEGYGMKPEKLMNDALFDCDNEGIVVVKSIELYSLCEHHLLPFFGTCHIGYLPNKKVIGLSKMGRFVDAFARRLQVQERLTGEIAECIERVTGAKGVAVMIEAQHLCMMMRGVQKQNAETITMSMRGDFEYDMNMRSEFERLVKK